MSSAPIRVIVVDDHPVARLGLVAIFELAAGIEVVGQAASVAEGLALFRRTQPDVAAFDLLLPDGLALDLVSQLRAETPEARVLIVTGAEGDEYAYRAMAAAVNGYLPKSSSPAALVAAVREIAAGGTALTPELRALLARRAQEPELTARELEVLRLIVEGRSNAEIGVALGMATGTARTHVSSILRKLGAADRTEAATAALRRGFV